MLVFSVQYWVFVSLSVLVTSFIGFYFLLVKATVDNQFSQVDRSFDRSSSGLNTDFRCLSSSRRWARANPCFERVDLHNAHVIAWKWHLQESRPPMWWFLRGVCWIDAWGGVQ